MHAYYVYILTNISAERDVHRRDEGHSTAQACRSWGGQGGSLSAANIESTRWSPSKSSQFVDEAVPAKRRLKVGGGRRRTLWFSSQIRTWADLADPDAARYSLRSG